MNDQPGLGSLIAMAAYLGLCALAAWLIGNALGLYDGPLKFQNFTKLTGIITAAGLFVLVAGFLAFEKIEEAIDRRRKGRKDDNG